MLSHESGDVIETTVIPHAHIAGVEAVLTPRTVPSDFRDRISRSNRPDCPRKRLPFCRDLNEFYESLTHDRPPFGLAGMFRAIEIGLGFGGGGDFAASIISCPAT